LTDARFRFTLLTMSAETQTFVALAIVALAALYLVRSAFANRRKGGCASGGSCPTDRFKQGLKR
jgi:hypothetical protein